MFELEKRGYVKAGPWTPEATVEHPEAVRQLHREFLRAGADVMQANFNLGSSWTTKYSKLDLLSPLLSLIIGRISSFHLLSPSHFFLGFLSGNFIFQAFTYYATEDKLVNRGNQAGVKIGVESINREACRIAKEVAAEGDALVLGGISQCPSYLSGKPKQAVQAEFAKQIKVFVEEGLDFLLCEVNMINNESDVIEWIVFSESVCNIP